MKIAIILSSICCCLFFVIGLPTYLVGCASFSCPLQNKYSATVTASYYVQETCSDSTCVSYSNRGCTSYVTNYYPCGEYKTDYDYGTGSCTAPGGPNPVGAHILIYVNKIDKTCTADLGQSERVAYTGIIFMSFMAFMLIFTIGLCSRSCSEDD